MFVVKVPLSVVKQDESVLSSRFNVLTHFYNAILREALKRQKKYVNSDDYQKARVLFKEGKAKEDELAKLKDKKIRKIKREEVKQILSRAKELYKKAREEAGYRESDVVEFGYKNVRKSFIEEHTTANVCNNLSKRAFVACDKLLKWDKGRKKANRVNFKSIKGPIHKRLLSITNGNSSSPALKWRNNCILWKGLNLKGKIDDNDPFHNVLKDNKVGEVKLVRKYVKNSWRYEAQLCINGNPPLKNRVLGVGEIGIDLGPTNIAFVTNKSAALEPLCGELKNLTQNIKLLRRKIDRQRRKNNPDNFNENGTAKKGRQWIISSRQKKSESKLREMLRKEKEYRACLHGIKINKIRSEGDVAKLEKIDYTEWQKRKKTSKGKKKQYGKSMGRHAPGMFVEKLKKRFEATNGSVIEINPYKTKLSQTCPNCGKIQKKDLKERVHDCDVCGYKMNRDLTSALLAVATTNDAVHADKAKKLCQELGPLLQAAWTKNKSANRRCKSPSLETSQSGSPVSHSDAPPIEECGEL